MTDQEVLAWLAETIEEVAGVPAEQVRPETEFGSLDVDSLSMVEIAVEAQDKTGVFIPDDELRGMTTIGHVIRHIMSQARIAAETGSP